MKRILIILTLALVARASMAQNESVLNEPATLIIYRKGQYSGFSANFSVYVNGELICKLSNNRYIEVTIPPGKINIIAVKSGVAINKKTEALLIAVSPGQTYYLQGNVKSSAIRYRMELSEVTVGTFERDTGEMVRDNCQQ
jgi:hypothetical protein